MTRCTVTVKLRYIRHKKRFYKNETKNSKQKDVGILYDYVKSAALLQTHTQDFNTRNSLPYVYDLQDSRAISCCYPNQVQSFLYEYFENYVYPNYTFSPSSGALVRTTTTETVRYLLALREKTKFCKISHYYPVCGHAFPPMRGNLIQ